MTKLKIHKPVDLMRLKIRPGDIIGTSGQGLVSDFINLGSLGVPRRGLSHIAIVGPYDPRYGVNLVYESTSFGRPACARQRKKVSGFQAHPLSEIVTPDTSRAYWYPLRAPLLNDEIVELERHLSLYLGSSYDFVGAGKSGGGCLKWLVNVLFGREDTTTLFCSEIVALILARLNRFHTRNASGYNPNSLIRRLRLQGICERGVQIA